MGNSSFIAGDGCCYGERQLGGYFHIYTHIYQEIMTGSLPRSGGTPVVGYRSELSFWPQIRGGFTRHAEARDTLALGQQPIYILLLFL